MKLFRRRPKTDEASTPPSQTGPVTGETPPADAPSVVTDTADSAMPRGVELETDKSLAAGGADLDGNTVFPQAPGPASESEELPVSKPNPPVPGAIAREAGGDVDPAIPAMASEAAHTHSVEVSADGEASVEVHSESPANPGGFYARLRRGLSRTGSQIASGLGDLFLGKKAVDEDLLEELESQLLMSDMGIEATQRVVDDMTARVSRRELADGDALLGAVKESLLDIIAPCEQPLDTGTANPFVILVVGVNGAGKTTTIGKLAKRLGDEGKKVMLAAGDTFRAAAVEQLQMWGERNNVPVVAQHTGADSASVIYDALQAARSRGVDVLIADTAGRLQNKAHLMDELEKVVRVMRKLEPDTPHETLLVLDAGTGQNAVSQAEQFDRAVGVSGIVLTKLDGTAKGGVIFAIAQRLSRPIRFIGVGESAEDLRPFEARSFVDALFDRRGT